MKLELLTHSEQETIEAGKTFAGRLMPGSVVAMFGDLGTGKTSFIKGICNGLGIGEHVASPTFTIVNEYQSSQLKVFHFDFYRITSINEIREIGFDEYIYGHGICLIEWADRVVELLPSNRFDVYLNLGTDENSREIIIHQYSEVPA